MIFYNLNKEKTPDSTRNKIIAVIATNFTTMCLKENQDSLANTPLKWLEEIAAVPENTFYKLLGIYFKNLLAYRENHQEKYKEAVLSTIQIISSVGMGGFSQELEQSWNKYKNK